MAAFVEHAGEILPELNKSYGGTLQKKQMDLVVAKAISQAAGNPGVHLVVAKVLDVFEQWAQETYEGHRIAAAFGIGGAPPAANDAQPFEKYFGLNLAKVVGDGCSTLVTLSNQGHPLGHHYLGQPQPNDQTFSPFAFIPMARWATGNKLALALNRGGEILAFSDGHLSFARRRGGWVHFSHEAAVSQMATNGPRGYGADLRLAAYLSALDISFARVGGGIGLVRRNETIVGEGLPVQARDRLSLRETDKTKALHALIGPSRYHELPRPLRQEIGGIDGAVVVQHDGTIITAGAVLAVSISSDEGARKTAAKTLGKYGLGIKISSDGKIEAYTGEPTPDQKPLFEIG